ncbi:cytochrome c oxidase subunit II [Adhaeribacter radiodurans]|uniref:Cytochrome c oxidase subunit 2 n=1 Tax=Adhaeribacter radiodurans TaxID=2745197 RepID=A0A7L7L359_9BACT|nr:cytochrome c oxidase subunit II [Adhaeribacter radiodurans]QMU27203.1 cytochrome c oxidase subunit II [Adhaeribacter radiodurans]
MITFAIVLSIILIGVILALLFRIQILSSIYSGSFQKRASKSNKINAVLFLLFLIVGGVAFIWSFQNAEARIHIPVGSVHGVWIDDMFWLTMVIIGIVFVITQILLFYYSYRYQYKDEKKAYYFPHNNKLEIIWTMIPAVVMALLVFKGWKTWTKITDPAPREAMVVEIVGKQFNWIARYPGNDNALGTVRTNLIDATNELGIDFSDQRSADDILPSEIHIPKGRPVLFKIRSRDVIHSFYLPHFRAQMHAVPGMPTKFWFVPTKTTADMATETGNPDFKYELVCNQICGANHFAMRAVVIVDEPEEYQKWMSAQKAFVADKPELLKNIKTPQGIVLDSKTEAPGKAAL